MPKKKTSPLFLGIVKILKLFVRRPTFSGELPDDPCVIVGNHCQIYGPIFGELYFPQPLSIWCAGAMMELKTVPAYAFQDFWSQKPKYSQPFFKVCSYLIAPLAAFLFTQAHTIAVHRDARVISTFKKSVEALNRGENLLIFPEHDVKFNHIIYELEENFIDLARLYYKRTGKELLFVPAYLAPKLKQVVFGTPIRFSAAADAAEERKRIRDLLAEEITRLATDLPSHTVIPYRNIPKRFYPNNKGDKNEKTTSQLP